MLHRNVTGLYFNVKSCSLILLGVFGIILLFIGSATIVTVHAAEVTLTWDANSESNLAGYRVYYGTSSKAYTHTTDVGNITAYTLTNLSDGQTYYFAATAYDVYGNESGFSEEVAYTIDTQNKPPVADAGPDQNIAEGATVTLSAGNSYDPNGGTVACVWKQTGGTAVALSDPGAVETTFTAPAVAASGETLTFTLTVTGASGLQAEDTCNVNIISANLAPSAEAGADQTVQEGAIVMLDGRGSTDPEGMALSYEWVQTGGSDISLMDANWDQPTFVAPNVGPEGVSLTFKLTVTDIGGLESTDTCYVNVCWVNAPPAADAGPDQSVKEGQQVTLDGSASTDPDDGILSYQWRQTGGTPVTLSSSSTSKPAFTAPSGHSDITLTFELTVTDNGGLNSKDSCVVNVSKQSNNWWSHWWSRWYWY